MTIGVKILLALVVALGLTYAVINIVQGRRRRLQPAPKRQGPVFHDHNGAASD